MRIRKTRVIILILILINLIALIIMGAIKNNNTGDANQSNAEQNEDEKLIYKSIDIDEEVKKEFLEKEQILPEGFTFLSRFYEGDVDTTYVFNKIYSLVYEIIPKSYSETKGLSDEEIKSYYNNNKQTIIEQLGIEDEETYLEFIKRITSVEVDPQNYTQSIFDFNQSADNGTYTSCELSILYNNYYTLDFTIYIANKTNTEPLIKIIPIEREIFVVEE